jgi:hypothetical protein
LNPFVRRQSISLATFCAVVLVPWSVAFVHTTFELLQIVCPFGAVPIYPLFRKVEFVPPPAVTPAPPVIIKLLVSMVCNPLAFVQDPAALT